MSGPCPDCGAPLTRDGFCKACAYDARLEAAAEEGADLDLPEGYGGEADFDYDAFLRSEGLHPDGQAAEPGSGPGWQRVAAAAILALLLLVLVLGGFFLQALRHLYQGLD